jgi:glycosyltransferase involved in cell wall biosynthesis
MKIVHIITRMCQGGAQENTYLTVKNQMSRGFEVALITGSVGKNEKKLKHSLDGINLFFIPELVREINPVKDVIAFLKILRILQKGRYEVVHTHISKAGVLGRIAAKAAGVPAVVHTPHGNVFYGYFSKLHTGIFVLIERMLISCTDRIITITENCKNEYISRSIGRDSKYVMIPSGVEEERYDRTMFQREKIFRKQMGIPENAFLAGCAARLVPIKGIKYLIEGMKFLDDSFYLAIAGDGEERDTLESLVRERGLDKRVIFLGMLKDIRQFLSELDVFVLPSLNEGMGRVLVEASLMGVPCVGSDVGGIPNVIIDGETGFLVPPKDGKKIAERLKYIKQNSELKEIIGKKAREYVKEKFGAKKMYCSIEKLYREILERKGKWKG